MASSKNHKSIYLLCEILDSQVHCINTLSYNWKSPLVKEQIMWDRISLEFSQLMQPRPTTKQQQDCRY